MSNIAPGSFSPAKRPASSPPSQSVKRSCVKNDILTIIDFSEQSEFEISWKEKPMTIKASKLARLIHENHNIQDIISQIDDKDVQNLIKNDAHNICMILDNSTNEDLLKNVGRLVPLQTWFADYSFSNYTCTQIFSDKNTTKKMITDQVNLMTNENKTKSLMAIYGLIKHIVKEDSFEADF